MTWTGGGLTLISAFTIFNFLAGKEDETVYREALETVQVLSAMGCPPHSIVGRTLYGGKPRQARRTHTPAGFAQYDAEWDQAAKNVDAFAKIVLEEYGMKSAAHPHIGGYLETDFENRRLAGAHRPQSGRPML